MAKITWTSTLVKQKLPRVKVKLFGSIHKGNISGRKNKFATVWFKQKGHIFEAKYSWAAVARALTADRALSLGKYGEY